MIQIKGLEPLIEILFDPKSNAFTNSAISKKKIKWE